MVVVIVVCVSAVGLGVEGWFLEPVQKRVQPISQRKIVMGMSIRITALLRTRMFLGRFKIMPDLNLAG
jgi:hypothetical protein